MEKAPNHSTGNNSAGQAGFESVYHFVDSNKSIEITKPDLPVPWINYLSNGTMHAFVSQAGGGFAWFKSATLGRLTRYRMHNLPVDTPGFYIYLKDRNGNVWSPTFRPCNSVPNGWSATHKPGVTEFNAKKDGLKVRLRLSIPPDYNVLVWDLSLENKSGSEVEYDVFAYTELSQMEWLGELRAGYYWEHMLNTWFDNEAGSLFYLFHNPYHPIKEIIPLVYFASSEDVQSFSGDRNAFIGNYRDESMPLAVEQSQCGSEQILSGDPCAAIHNKICIAPSEQKRVYYYLGAIPEALSDVDKAVKQAKTDLEALRHADTMDVQYDKQEQWWNEHLAVYESNIPDKVAERQINIWSPLNSVQAGRYSRSINARAPGVRTTGYRDTCQDMLAIAYRKPRWAMNAMELLLAYQYEDGHAAAAFDELTGSVAALDARCDLHLWLPFTVYAILAETGDYGWLDLPISFLSSSNEPSVQKGSVWEHLLAGIHFTRNNLGIHGLPLTLGGDWNDTIHVFAEEGKGESVFAGQQYVKALGYMMEMAEKAKPQDLPFLATCMKQQRDALLECAWDGALWRRCFDDNGNAIGGINSDDSSMYLNPQSWAVISSVGDSRQLMAGMDQVYARLNTRVGLKLLERGLKTWPDISDPKTGYNPGCGENGAIFCHANTWAIIAEALLGRGERAWEYFTKLIPHNNIMHNGLEKYCSEPYAWVSNIVGPENPRFGYGNIAHITGAAAWMDVAATQYLLGVRPTLSGLIIDPCIPASWDHIKINRRFLGREFQIEVNNCNKVGKGVSSICRDKKSVIKNSDGSINIEQFGEATTIHLEVCM